MFGMTAHRSTGMCEHHGLNSGFEQGDGACQDTAFCVDSANMDATYAMPAHFVDKVFLNTTICRLIDNIRVGTRSKGKLSINRTQGKSIPTHQLSVKGFLWIVHSSDGNAVEAFLQRCDANGHVPCPFVDEAILNVEDKQLADGHHVVASLKSVRMPTRPLIYTREVRDRHVSDSESPRHRQS